MTATPTQFTAATVASTDETTFYVAPENTVSTITAFTVKNNASAPATLTVYLVSGGSTASDTPPIATPTLAAGKSYIVDEAISQSLVAGGSIVVQASAADALAVAISGVEFT